jgi:hypothetical protein
MKLTMKHLPPAEAQQRARKAARQAARSIDAGQLHHYVLIEKTNYGMPQQPNPNIKIDPLISSSPTREPNGTLTPDQICENRCMSGQSAAPSPMPTKSTTTKKKSQSKKGGKSSKTTSLQAQRSPTVVGPSGVHTPTASTITALSGKKTKKSTSQRKAELSSSSNRSLTGDNTPPYSSSKTSAPVQVQEKFKEYSDMMEMVENIVDYDPLLCYLILNEKKSVATAASGMVNISEEQKKLLYGDGMGSSKDTIAKDSVRSNDQDDTSSLPLHFKGWGDRNVISARTAWAKLRLEEENKEDKPPLTLPAIQPKEKVQASKPSSTAPPSSWINEEKAEEDEALALISEATQQYLKTILEAAMSSARQRMNLDGIRLWHQQLSAAAAKDKEASASIKSVAPELISDPPLYLRLGCDVRRQYAMAEGNASKTCQRMEEALARKEKSAGAKKYSLDEYETLYDAGSMSELAQFPIMPEASKKADNNAQRCFEIYGGKHSSDPPLGRVPKKVKISVPDIQMCVEGPRIMGTRRKRKFSSFY